jgi:hypothetical protein
MFGATGDLMNTIMASQVAQERMTAAPARTAGGARAPRPVAVRSAFAAGWGRIRALVGTVLP